MEPWFEQAMDLISTRNFPFSNASSVFDDEFLRMGANRKSRTRIQPRSEQNVNENELEYDELKKKLMNSHDEVLKLQAANSDLTQVNKRWHRYNTDMQLFIDRLQSTIRDQQEQINKIAERPFTQPKSGENVLCDKKVCRNLRDEVERLKGEVEHLQFQVKSHKEDWEAEKNEKNEVVKERDVLKQKLNYALRDLCFNSEGPVSDENRVGRQKCRSCETCTDSLRVQTSEPAGYLYDRKQFSGEDTYTNEHSKSLIACSSEGAASLERHMPGVSGYNLRPKTESYSLNSTLPLTSSPSPCSSNGSIQSDPRAFSMGIKTSGNVMTSYFKLPIVKSSSAPDRNVAFKNKPFVNSISLSVLPPGANGKQKVLKEVQNNISVETEEDFVCPHCSSIFPPNNHLMFLDHFENCPSN